MKVWRDGTSGSASSALTPSSCLCIISEWRDSRGVTLNSLKSAFFTTCSRYKFVTYVAFITIAGQFIFLFNLFGSMKFGKKASDNPWEATTLEWTTATPPPHDNFA